MNQILETASEELARIKQTAQTMASFYRKVEALAQEAIIDINGQRRVRTPAKPRAKEISARSKTGLTSYDAYTEAKARIYTLLSDGKARTAREIQKELGLFDSQHGREAVLHYLSRGYKERLWVRISRGIYELKRYQQKASDEGDKITNGQNSYTRQRSQ